MPPTTKPPSPGGGRPAATATGGRGKPWPAPRSLVMLISRRPSLLFPLFASARGDACPPALIYAFHDYCLLFFRYSFFFVFFCIFIYSSKKTPKPKKPNPKSKQWRLSQ